MSTQSWQSGNPKVGLISSYNLSRDDIHFPNEAKLNDINDGGDTSSSTLDSEEDEDTCTAKTQGEKANNSQHSNFNVANSNGKTMGKVSKRDGRLDISVNETSNHGYLAKALGAPFLRNVKHSESISLKNTEKVTNNKFSNLYLRKFPPMLNIVVMVIGSRGDIQPFVKLGKNLKSYGHRVRIATHPAFKKFVQDESGLEFFSVGGDPTELMAFMVKNPGLIPTMETVKKGEIGRRRNQMAEMFEGFWRACINETDDEKDCINSEINARVPFVADAIIANPPSFAHIHCAERLGIPLHLMFTFPYTPTQEFPHPLANVMKSNSDSGYTNFMSYPLVEMMTWQGLGDLVNNFRVKTLGLEPVSTLWAPGQLYRMKVPYTYLWSPTLIPKPKDWGPEIDIAGFVFLDLASSYEPPKSLLDFLEEGPPPIYIGFGSIIVENPEEFTKIIFDAVKISGVRALVSKGWGNFGGDKAPDNIFLLGNVPHDWLFPRVSAVVHHGGCGTTAVGMKYAKPTMIIPFFGDQHFWGKIVEASGAGASPVPYKNLNVKVLSDGIKKCLSSEARISAEKIANNIEAEGDGAVNAMKLFHKSLVLTGINSMRCSILEDRVAVWKVKKTNVRLSALAAEILVKQKKLNWRQLNLVRHNEWGDFEGPGEPLTGGATAVLGTVTGIATSIGSIPYKITRNTKRRVKYKKSRQKKINAATCDKIIDEKMLNQHKIGRFLSKKKGKTRDRKSNRHAESKIGDQIRSEIPHGSNKVKQSQHENCKDRVACSDDSCDPGENVSREVAGVVGIGLGKAAKKIAKAPIDLSFAVSQGFHNAPRLYGDNTVRRPIKITGIKSGLKAASKEFFFGIYDGITGLAIQPYTGACDDGIIGFIKGVSKGLTGLILKDLAAIIGPFGYTLKGIQKEFSRHKKSSKGILRARINEGIREIEKLDKNDLERNLFIVLRAWSLLKRIKAFMNKRRPSGFRGSIHMIRERKRLKASGGFDNVRIAEKALEALNRDGNLNDFFVAQEAESNSSQNPRENTAKDVKGKGRETE